jgi:bacterioferritin-associated ferredoxin
MDRNSTPQMTCDACPERFLCRCLQVTENEVVAAITVLDIRTLKEVRQHTGAGDGCNGCHRLLRQLLDRHASSAPDASSALALGACGSGRTYSSSSAEPICSVK